MRWRGFSQTWIAGLASAAFTAEPVEAEGTQALANASQNPVADLISVPLENNVNFGIARLGYVRVVFRRLSGVLQTACVPGGLWGDFS